MKKILSITLLASFLALVACEKEIDEPKQNPIVGLWIGTYEVPNSNEYDGSYYYSFTIKADSSILIHSQGADGNTYYGIGTWSLSGNTFTAQSTATNLSQNGTVQNITAVYNSVDGTLRNGQVMNVGSSFTATFSLDRIN